MLKDRGYYIKNEKWDKADKLVAKIEDKLKKESFLN